MGSGSRTDPPRPLRPRRLHSLLLPDSRRQRPLPSYVLFVLACVCICICTCSCACVIAHALTHCSAEAQPLVPPEQPDQHPVRSLFRVTALCHPLLMEQERYVFLSHHTRLSCKTDIFSRKNFPGIRSAADRRHGRGGRGTVFVRRGRERVCVCAFVS
jgi:hypothetical protein